MRAIARNIHTSIDWFLFAHLPDMVLYANFCNNENQTTAGPGMGIGVLGIYEYTTSHESNTSILQLLPLMLLILVFPMLEK